jgi:hypothetical protein
MDLDKLNIDDLGLEFFNFQEVVKTSNIKDDQEDQQENK